MPSAVPLARPRRGAHARAAGLTTFLAGAALSAAWFFQAQTGLQQVDAAAAPFVSSPRPLLLRRGDAASRDVSMFNSRRNKKYYQPKKTHIRFYDLRQQYKMHRIPFVNKRLSILKEWNLEQFAQTLKLTFAEGEEEIVTEEEVRAYFTTDDYAPDGIIFAPAVAFEKNQKWKEQGKMWNDTKIEGRPHTYVHFATIEECHQARKERKVGDIGAAKEVIATFAAEKKWIRLKDGMRLQGWGRARWMKPYGEGRYEGWNYGGYELAPETGSRDNPYYPY